VKLRYTAKKAPIGAPTKLPRNSIPWNTPKALPLVDWGRMSIRRAMLLMK